VTHTPPARDQFRGLAANLAAIPAWLVVTLGGSVIALSAAAAGYAIRRFRARLRPPFDFRSFLGAMKWAMLLSVALVPLMYVFVFDLLWLQASTGEDVVDAPPRWLIPGIVLYVCAFAGPPALFTLHGSRRSWRAWLRR
jgi:hypothetical protein